MSFATADLYDAHGDALRSCVTQFRSYGSRARFSGQIATVRCLEDNALVNQVLATPGECRVLVVVCGASLCPSLLVYMISTSPMDILWPAVVITGALLDPAAPAPFPLRIQ